MSASTEKKLRRAAREAGTDKKTAAAQAEAKKKAQSRIRWTAAGIGVVLLVAVVILFNTGLLYSAIPAVTIAGENYTPAQVGYCYGSSYYSWANQYGGYASVFGLDTSGGIYGLDSQDCPMMEGSSWRDYFLDAAITNLTQTQAIAAYAAENGIELSQEEIDSVDQQLTDTETYAQSMGYSGINNFLSSNYGRGVKKDAAREYALRAQLATDVLQKVEDDLDYTDQELEEYYQGLEGESDVFDFVYYYAAAETVETEGEDGETTSEPTEETKAAAKSLAEDIVADYEAAVAASAGEPDYAALFDEAVAAHVEGGSATHPTNSTGGGLGAYKDFLMGDRKAGDADTVENSAGNGWYAVAFLSRDDNHYPVAQVRHILVMAEAGEDGTYSDEAKAAAKARAEEILAEWEAGEKTEESFAALAEQYSEDTGSNTNGGLYDAVHKGQMVPEFDAFCFAGHKPGDTAIVYGESSSYAGYHVMYYVGEGELYSSSIARSALTAEDMDAWLTDLVSGYEAVRRFGLRFVG